jgi:aryl-alcohol dehydrogenase-like predicted oxidoreductase
MVLGRTGLSVTRSGYGAMEIRGSRIWGGRPVTDAQAERILNAVLDAGLTFLDTANDYGRSEEFIGKYLAHRRTQYALATKCGCHVVQRDAARWQQFAQAGLDDLRAEGESRTQFLLRFTLTHPHTQTIIVGTLDPEHLEENLRAIGRGPLSPEVYAEAKRRFEAVGERPVVMA